MRALRQIITYYVYVDNQEDKNQEDLDAPSWVVQSRSVREAVESLLDEIADACGQVERVLVHDVADDAWFEVDVVVRPSVGQVWATSLESVMGECYAERRR